MKRCFQFFIHVGCYDKSKYWCLKFSNYCSHIFVTTSCPKTCGRCSGMLISPLNEKCRMKQVLIRAESLHQFSYCWTKKEKIKGKRKGNKRESDYWFWLLCNSASRRIITWNPHYVSLVFLVHWDVAFFLRINRKNYFSSIHVVGSQCLQLYTFKLKQSTVDIESDILCFTDGGTWSSWSPYSPCSKSCNGGYQFRSRKCNNASSVQGRSACSGPSMETQICNQFVPCSGIHGKKKNKATNKMDNFEIFMIE